MTTPEGDPGEDPQWPSGHEKMPTVDLDSCVMALWIPGSWSG